MKIENAALCYQIAVRNLLDEKLVRWLDEDVIEIESHSESNQTIMTVRIPDQAALRGFFNKLWDLNLTLISVCLIESNN